MAKVYVQGHFPSDEVRDLEEVGLEAKFV